MSEQTNIQILDPSGTAHQLSVRQHSNEHWQFKHFCNDQQVYSQSFADEGAACIFCMKRAQQIMVMPVTNVLTDSLIDLINAAAADLASLWYNYDKIRECLSADPRFATLLEANSNLISNNIEHMCSHERSANEAASRLINELAFPSSALLAAVEEQKAQARP
jgi:hypothetical protein